MKAIAVPEDTQDVAPIPVWYVPLLQVAHAVAPKAVEYVPVPHWAHVVSPQLAIQPPDVTETSETHWSSMTLVEEVTAGGRLPPD